MTTVFVGRVPSLLGSVVDSAKRTEGGISVRNGKKVLRVRLVGDRGRCVGRKRSLHLLDSSLTNAWHEWRMTAKAFAQFILPVGTGVHRGPVVVNDLGGQYEDSFEDVDKHLVDYFTYKAVRTVLAQLFEMNPAQYAWLYGFVVNNKPKDSKLFLQLLVKERQELGERVMVTRLHLFNKWTKKYNAAKLHKAISDENLELLRERLIQTVRFPSSNADDAEKPNLR